MSVRKVFHQLQRTSDELEGGFRRLNAFDLFAVRESRAKEIFQRVDVTTFVHLEKRANGFCFVVLDEKFVSAEDLVRGEAKEEKSKYHKKDEMFCSASTSVVVQFGHDQNDQRGPAGERMTALALPGLVVVVFPNQAGLLVDLREIRD